VGDCSRQKVLTSRLNVDECKPLPATVSAPACIPAIAGVDAASWIADSLPVEGTPKFVEILPAAARAAAASNDVLSSGGGGTSPLAGGSMENFDGAPPAPRAWQILLETSYDVIEVKKRGFKCESIT
jgi:hypothetical protein